MSNDDPALLRNPNLLIHYLSEDNLQRLESVVAMDDYNDAQNMGTIFFMLYTPENGYENPYRFKNSANAEELVNDGSFVVDRETVIFVHGFATNYGYGLSLAQGKKERVGSYYVMVSKLCLDIVAYLSNPDLSDKNVILVDWSWLANPLNYLRAAQCAVSAGTYSGDLLGKLLVQQLGVDPKDIHVIGHSLGAHFAGHLSRQLTVTGGKGKPYRVTG